MFYYHIVIQGAPTDHVYFQSEKQLTSQKSIINHALKQKKITKDDTLFISDTENISEKDFNNRPI